MKKKIVIIHGWGGSPKENWYRWLNAQLNKSGFEPKLPAMPDSLHPKINKWTAFLDKTVGEVDENTYLVGHSIGCQTILRYLEKLEPNKKIGGVLFVAGWMHLTDETWDQDYTPEIADQWLTTPIDFEKVKNHGNNFIAIQSDDDPYVPITDAKIFAEKLGAKIIKISNAGHISCEDSFETLPIALNSIKQMISENIINV